MKKVLINLFIIAVVIQASILLIAAAPVNNDSKYDLSCIENDLTGAIIGGKAFNIDDYVANPSESIRPIYFSEFCFSYNFSELKDYSLYVYLYNPGNEHININSLKNKISIATQYKNNDPIVYTKFELKFCNRTKNNMLYKFKVIDDDNIILNSVLSNYEINNKRRYDIGGIEILGYGEQQPAEYLYGMSCLYTGYGKGYGEDKNISTLQIQVKDLQTIKLRVNSTNYLTSSSSMGPYHKNNISSVYFSVPNNILKQYGYLDSISAEWDEYQTQPILVTSNKDFYNGMYDLRKNQLINEDSYSPLRLFYGATTMQGTSNQVVLPGGAIIPGRGPDVKWEYDWAYGINNNSGEKLDGGHFEVAVNSNSKQLPYVFYSEQMDDKSIFEDLNYKTVAGQVNKNKLIEYMYSYKNQQDYIENDNIENELFTNELDELRKNNTNVKRGYNNITAYLEDTYELDSYNSNHNWIDRLIDYGFTQPDGLDEGDVKFNAIQKISDGDLSGEISNRLLINSLDEKDFKEYCYDAMMSEETPYLFRFAVSDYYSRAVGRYSSIDGISDCDEKNSDSYIAQQTVFLNFDIISLRFAKDEEYTVIPVISNPMDIASTVVPPPIEYSVIDLGIGHIKETFKGLGAQIKAFWNRNKNIIMPILIVVIIIATISLIMGLVNVIQKKRNQNQKIKIIVETQDSTHESDKEENNVNSKDE